MSPPQMHTPAEAAALFRPTDTFGFGLGPGQPVSLLHALGDRTDWVDLQIGGALLVDLYALFGHAAVHYRSGFFGPAERFLKASGADIQFVPADFRRFAPILELQAPRIMSTVATPPDADGFLSLSLHAGATVDELHRAGADPQRVLMVEVNPRLPRTMGSGDVNPHRLHLDEIDVMIDGERDPFVLPDAEPTDVERRIAEHAAPFIPDGATIQTGIGGVPSMIAGLLAEGDGGDYGIHTEMFTSGLMRLQRSGKVTNQHKGFFDGFSVATFAAGTVELYEWLDDNPDVRFLPVSVVNSPEVVAHNRNMVTINGALAIDLSGQIVADNLGGTQFSGIGGHEDFLAAAGLSLDDRSLVCLPSRSMVQGQAVDRVVSRFETGTVVTSPRHQLDVVVTEWGAAELRGRTVRERAKALAAIAHPDVRDQLLADAEIWPPG